MILDKFINRILSFVISKHCRVENIMATDIHQQIMDDKELVEAAMKYLPQNDGIDWKPICMKGIAELDGTIEKCRQGWSDPRIPEWRRRSPIAIAEKAFEFMPLEYKFGVREKWLRRLDEVYWEAARQAGIKRPGD